MRLSVDGHSDSYHALAVVNSATMTTGMHVSFQMVFFSDMCPGVGLLDHMVAVFLVFFMDPAYCSPLLHCKSTILHL